MHLISFIGFLVGAVATYLLLPIEIPVLKLILAVTPGGLASYIATLMIADTIYGYLVTRKAEQKLVLQNQ